MQIKDVTKRRDDEVVIHYIDDDGNYQSLRAYPSDIIAWHRAAQQSVQSDGAESVAPKAECEDCGLPYSEFKLDMTLPDEQWISIHPSDENGLLCARCIVARSSNLKNIVAVRAVLDDGTPRR